MASWPKSQRASAIRAIANPLIVLLVAQQLPFSSAFGRWRRQVARWSRFSSSSANSRGRRLIDWSGEVKSAREPRAKASGAREMNWIKSNEILVELVRCRSSGPPARPPTATTSNFRFEFVFAFARLWWLMGCEGRLMGARSSTQQGLVERTFRRQTPVQWSWKLGFIPTSSFRPEFGSELRARDSKNNNNYWQRE